MFFTFYIWLLRLLTQKVKIIQFIFVLVVNNKGNRVFMSRNYRSKNGPVSKTLLRAKVRIDMDRKDISEKAYENVDLPS